MYQEIDISWNLNRTPIQTEKQMVILKSSGADPSPSLGEHGSGQECYVLGSGWHVAG
jgi:hypothetical protein